MRLSSKLAHQLNYYMAFWFEKPKKKAINWPIINDTSFNVSLQVNTNVSIWYEKHEIKKA